MPIVLIAIPLIAAAIAAVVPSNRLRPWVLPPAGVAHVVASFYAVWGHQPESITRWLALDPPGRLVLLIVSILFLICAVYSVGYLRYRSELSNRLFCICLLLFLAMA